MAVIEEVVTVGNSVVGCDWVPDVVGNLVVVWREVPERAVECEVCKTDTVGEECVDNEVWTLLGVVEVVRATVVPVSVLLG